MVFPAIDVILPFLVIAAVAAYFQTVTGFGMGMIIIGATSTLGVVPIAIAVAVINFLALSNSAIALPGKFDHINWRMIGAVLVAAVPAIFVGIVLLSTLSGSAATAMRMLLGVLIIGGGVSIMLRSSRCAQPSGMPSFMASGAFSGLVGGMFGIFGPPLIYQFYRQPLPQVSIRNMLITIFAVTASTRIVLIGLRGDLTSEILILSALTIPIVALATMCGRRFPPSLSPEAMRRIVVVVLVGLGSKLLVTSAYTLIA